MSSELTQPAARYVARRAVRIQYKNWKGEVSWRNVLPLSIGFESTEWHPKSQWILHAHDLDKDAPRSFAIADIRQWLVPQNQPEGAEVPGANLPQTSAGVGVTRPRG